MSDDQLRQRIARLDPSAGAATEPITSPAARALLEDIMNTPIVDRPTAGPTPDRPTRRTPLRPVWWRIAGVAAVAVAALALGAALFTGGDDTSDVADPATTAPASPPGKLKVLDLSTGVEDTMAMCLQVTPEGLAEMQVAFKATVDTADGGIVTMTIDEAYQGTDAQVVTLSAPEGMEALIGGVEFVPGEQYLITAYDGVVNYCGFSGPATPELQAIFDQAFPR